MLLAVASDPIHDDIFDIRHGRLVASKSGLSIKPCIDCSQIEISNDGTRSRETAGSQ